MTRGFSAMKNIQQKILILLLLFSSGFLGILFSLYTHQTSSEAIQTIQTFHYPALFVKQLAGDPQAGKKIFKEFCAACHSQQPRIDIKAPHIGDKNAWEIRRKWGVDNLLKITIEGVGAMPARGGCFECSDEQLKQAIEYILNSK